MTVRGAAIAILGVCALLLSGCVTARDYPAGFTAEQLEAERQRVLDLTWQNMGLEDETRPQPQLLDLPADAVWDMEYFECASQNGSASDGFGYSGSSGFEFSSGDGPGNTDLLVSYACVASLPLVPYAVSELRTPEQVDYLYGYYKSWLVPCLLTQGLVVAAAPTRSEFEALGGLWTPYQDITLADLLNTDDLIDTCGRDPGNERINEMLDYLQLTVDDIEQDD